MTFKYTGYLPALLMTLVSCGVEDDPDPGLPEGEAERVVLVYAVNRNNLSYNLEDDSSEMLKAMSAIASDRYQLLLFRTDSETECGLYRAVPDDTGDYDFDQVKLFPRDVTSTHPERIAEVIEYSVGLFPEAACDLVFWGHGMSWKPYFTDHNVAPVKRSYGGEYNPDRGNLDWIEIDELAAAIPDHTFDTIWFDCCYMSGIETIYEFREKCSTFVGYPTEVWDSGLAYDRVLPYLLRDNPDVKGAARAFYEYYNATSDPVTVAVVDMSKIETVADVASEILNSGALRPEEYGLINYSRTSSAPFYDFAMYFTQTARLNGREDLSDSLNMAMDELVTYHAESAFNFNRRPWNTSDISGISTHYYVGGESAEESYYRTLSWFKRVY